MSYSHDLKFKTKRPVASSYSSGKNFYHKYTNMTHTSQLQLDPGCCTTGDDCCGGITDMGCC